MNLNITQSTHCHFHTCTINPSILIGKENPCLPPKVIPFPMDRYEIFIPIPIRTKRTSTCKVHNHMELKSKFPRFLNVLVNFWVCTLVGMSTISLLMT